MLRLKGWNGFSLVACAAYNGDKATFETVLTTVRGRLKITQVRNCCLAMANDHFRLAIEPSELKFSILVTPFNVIPTLTMVQSDEIYRSFKYVAILQMLHEYFDPQEYDRENYSQAIII